MNNKLNLKYAVISTTGVCNLSCRHCFRVENNANYLSIDRFYACIESLKLIGVTHVNFTGGEPMLCPDIREIIKISKKNGFTNILSTNGILLGSLNDDNLNDIHTLCLPLDGHDAMYNDEIRGDGHYEKVSRLIDDYRSNDYNFNLKINTLVTSYNIDSIRRLPSKLESANTIHLKLFQVSNRGILNYTKKVDSVSDNDFLNLYHYIIENYPHINVNYLMVNDPSNYVIIDSVGEMKYIVDDKYYTVTDFRSLPFTENSFEQTSLGKK